jgi:hypothetical protein
VIVEPSIPPSCCTITKTQEERKKANKALMIKDKLQRKERRHLGRKKRKNTQLITCILTLKTS